MVVWNILLSIFLVLSCFVCLVERKRIIELSEFQHRIVATLVRMGEAYKEYTDQAVLAHEKMAHTGYEKYEPKS